jgi:hypothetical protein
MTARRFSYNYLEEQKKKKNSPEQKIFQNFSECWNIGLKNSAPPGMGKKKKKTTAHAPALAIARLMTKSSQLQWDSNP